MIVGGLLAGLMLGSAAGASEPVDAACESSFSIETLRRDASADPGGDPAMNRTLVDYGACLAVSGAGDRACRALRPFLQDDPDFPTLESACRSHADFLRFAGHAAGGRIRPAVADCVRWLAPSAGRRFASLSEACVVLARAFGPGWIPACALLSSPPIAAEGADVMAVERFCRLELYPVYGCSEAGHSADLAACVEFSSTVSAVRRGDAAACGESESCRAAVSPGAADCARSLRRAARVYCGRSRAAGR